MARKTRGTINAAAVLATGINHSAALLDAPPAPSSCCPPEQPAACNACLTAATAPNAPTAILAAHDDAIADPFADTIDPADEPTVGDLVELHEWTAQTTACEHLDRSAVLSLPDLIEHTAEFFAAWPTGVGSLIAEALRELAAKVHATGATTPDEYRDRIAVMEDEARQQHEEVGYQEGLAAGREECRRKHGQTPSSGFGGHPASED
jgi:hypothetical protein